MTHALDFSSDTLARIGRRLTWTLFAAQSLGSAGFIASATLASILGAELGGSTAWAGVPSAVYLAGTAGAALAWGYLMDVLGRRGGLVLGLMAGTLGAGLAFLAVNAGAFGLFLVGLALMGVASAAVTLGRFASAEVHPPAERGRAISTVVLGGTVGAVLGPLLVGPAGAWAERLGRRDLSGAYAVSGLMFLTAGVLIFAALRPDPRQVGKAVAALYPPAIKTTDGVRSLRVILGGSDARLAMIAMVLGQAVMVMVMVITSLHMRAHAHGLGEVSAVISSHTLGMYAFSVVSGRLADRWGRRPTIALGAAGLVLACMLATLSPDVVPLAVALFILGLGWNLCFVGGSTLLADQLTPDERARTQGFNDLCVGLASAAGSLGSGLVFAALGYSVMAWTGAALALVPLALAMRRLRPKPLAPASE
ncbi:MAG: MFS transporter [Anaerolineales bacterium]|nr:MFS transporter [Anaerolineales bacterium]